MGLIEDLGVSFVHREVAKMGYFFRGQPIHDFGVDAHIETKNAEGNGTGRNIAVQIKSGSSYIKKTPQGDIIYHPEKRHIHYWAEHSLPVILVIYDPAQDMAWWCDIKAYISRHPSILSHGPYTIIVPTTQQFSAATSDKLLELSLSPQIPLTLKEQIFSTIAIKDNSTNEKRCEAKILVGNDNKDIVRLAIYQATQHLKTVVEHRSDHHAALWGEQTPRMITLFVYRDLDDEARGIWIAHTIWRDPKSNAAKQVIFGKPNDFTEDIEIEFADGQRQQVMRQLFAEHVTTKYQFLKKVTKWIALSDDLVNQAINLTQRLDERQITEETYVESMIKLANAYTEIQKNYDDGTTGPSEVRDVEIKFAGTIGSGISIFLPFTPHGLKSTIDPKRRNLMVNHALKMYINDHEMLRFEMAKLGH